jgi:hypothetical protein
LYLCALCTLCAFGVDCVQGQSTLDVIGLTGLQARDASLTGSGVIVAQVESGPNPLQFEVDPGTAGQPVRLFSYRSTIGGAATFPNAVGSESSHAGQVAQSLYGQGSGVAAGLRHVGNYETDYFFATVIEPLVPLTARVFNQSFEFGSHDAAQDQAYDDYIAEFHTVVASGAGNGGTVLTPADCYNGLGVAAYGGSSSVGPSADGRCKPDITAPAGATSFSTPLVSGAAAILIQGGRREGANAAAAVDSRTVKALLLNGAVKPPGWSHTAAVPLDYTYGAGVLNISNAYADLAGGRHGPVAIGYSRARQHPPLAGGPATPAERGWDYRGISSNAIYEGIGHYRIATGSAGALAATLVWNKGYKATAINRLELYCYAADGTLLASSLSAADNVQHIYLTGLAPGTYELEVVKIAGPLGSAGVVSSRETYALAWDFER